MGLAAIYALIVEVALIDDAMGVIAILPDGGLQVVADGEGEATFDELNAAFDGLVRGRC